MSFGVRPGRSNPGPIGSFVRPTRSVVGPARSSDKNAGLVLDLLGLTMDPLGLASNLRNWCRT